MGRKRTAESVGERREKESPAISKGGRGGVCARALSVASA